MYIQIVNFHLKDISEQDYYRLCDDVASAFADVPGLLSKVWLADPATNTYGGVYTWRERAALDAFKSSEIFRGVATNPHLADVTSREFAVIEGPTRITRGLAGVTA